MDRGMLRRALWWGLGVGLAGVFAFGLFLYANAPSSGGPPADYYALPGSGGGELPVLWEAPAFSFTAHDGAKVTNAELAGHVWIADFIFTRCTTVCPLITARMTLLQKKLKDPSLRFVSFSVDPEHDTPQALAEYAMKWNAEERRWVLLSTDAGGLQQVASGMKVAVMPSEDVQNPIIHSNLFMLVDAQGKVRGAYNSGDRDALARLEQDARKLLGQAAPEPAAPGTLDGAQLFAAYKCGACHDDARVAPPLGGLVGRAVSFEDGGQKVADAAYVKESIVSPGAHLVAGYLPLMPPYDRELTDEQVDALVEFVSRLEAPKDAGTGAAEVAEFAVDPICKMKVRAAPSTLHAERDGQTFYFCSETCKERFEAQAPGSLKP